MNHERESAIERSRQTYDTMARRGGRFARPVNRKDLEAPLLPRIDPWGWLGGNIRGWRILCLAAGGGRQGPLYAAAGGDVTVVDISPEMLRLDREVARTHRLHLNTVEGSMDDLSMFAPSTFDLCIHPVSTCYVPEITSVFQQIARIMCPDGLYVSQHKTPGSLQGSTRPTTKHATFSIETPYYTAAPLPPVIGSLHREEGAVEYLHRWEELVGGMCRAGFVIEDLVEPRHGNATSASDTFAYRSYYLAPYVRIKARRRSTDSDDHSSVPSGLQTGHKIITES